MCECAHCLRLREYQAKYGDWPPCGCDHCCDIREQANGLPVAIREDVDNAWKRRMLQRANARNQQATHDSSEERQQQKETAVIR